MKKWMAAILMAGAGILMAGCGAPKDSGTGSPADGSGIPAETQQVPPGAAGAGTEDDGTAEETGTLGGAADGGVNPAGDPDPKIRIGVICAGDEKESSIAGHLAAVGRVQKALELPEEAVLVRTPGEGEAYEELLKELAEQSDIIFACGAVPEEPVRSVAAANPGVQVCQAGGGSAPESGIANLHNYYVSVYEAQYVAGAVAGLKLNEMIAEGSITAEAAKLGYVAAHPEAAEISAFTAFYLGAGSVCPSAVMDVYYTKNGEGRERDAVSALAGRGCVLIGLRTDMAEAAEACEEKDITYIGSYADMQTPPWDGALATVLVDWEPYLTYAVSCVLEGTWIDTDWCRGYADGVVGISGPDVGNAAEGTAEKIAELEQSFREGSVKVFDTATFTVGGSALEELTGEGGAYDRYGMYVYDGYFHESEFGSRPVFDLIVDGITVCE